MDARQYPASLLIYLHPVGGGGIGESWIFVYSPPHVLHAVERGAYNARDFAEAVRLGVRDLETGVDVGGVAEVTEDGILAFDGVGGGVD